MSWHSLCQHLMKHGGCQQLSVRWGGGGGVGGNVLMWQDMTCTLLLCSCQAKLHASLMTSPLLAMFTLKSRVYFWSSLQNSVITPKCTAACANDQVADNILNVTECPLNIPFYNESNEEAVCETRPWKKRCCVAVAIISYSGFSEPVHHE